MSESDGELPLGFGFFFVFPQLVGHFSKK